MKNKFLLLIALIISLNSFCQKTNLVLEKKIDEIYTIYNESCKTSKDKILGKYPKTNIKELEKTKDYIDDYSLFLREKEKHQLTKISELKNLLRKTEIDNPFIGEQITITKDSNNSDAQIKILTSNVSEIRNDLAAKFNEDYSDYSDDPVIRTKINFVVDSDGKLKKISCTGENEEMNLYTSLLLYSLDKRINPLIEENKIIPQYFTIPLSLNFQ